MPSVYTPNAANNPSTYTQPSDGDNANAASVLTMMQALADKGAYLGGYYKALALGYSQTIVTATLASGTPAVVVQATIPSTNLLATDYLLVVSTLGVSSTSGGATPSFIVTGGTSQTVLTGATWNPGSVAGYSPICLSAIGAAVSACTTVKLSLSTNVSVNVTAATLLAVILRAG